MPRGQGSRDRKLRRGRPAQSRTQVPLGVQVLKDEEKEAAASASSSSPSSYASVEATAREEPGSGTPSCPQDTQRTFSPRTALNPTPRSQCTEGSSRQGEEGVSSSQGKDASQVMQDELLSDKLDKLLSFLLHKYQKKEQVTVEEMLHIVDQDYHAYCPLIFRLLCACMFVNFGIEMREVDSAGHTYELVPILGLTYSGILDNEVQISPKAELLILILSTIIVKGNRLSEGDLRDLLRSRQALAERQHDVGDPWKFITEDLVREGYLVYQQVPNSDPARCEFLWGPRAQAETTEMKVLRHMFRLDGIDLRSHPQVHNPALRKENGNLRPHNGQDE
ncbi:PREDICTED: melanoma-associated antigen 8-like [Chinchilla lanigera]|uniref:melanoma-associated antigen 8-like n=1 Tax=Chinchilla lanigera TaxID=34839 RepID=UPI00038EB671|nr:PREDICTED: melanoma-associated antigen 8-like [Chinchilla lanigera]